MKYLFIILTILCSNYNHAQDIDSRLFQTWYLYQVYSGDDSNTNYVVSEIEPTITPSLTISNDLTYTGSGACNTFNGIFSMSSNSEVFCSNAFTATTNTCNNASHNSFESEYFSFMELACGFTIVSENGTLVLNMFTPIFGAAVFKNRPLSTTTPTSNAFTVYPNPTQGVIHFQNKNSRIEKVEFYNSTGQHTKTITNTTQILDIADFADGLYFMKLHDTQGNYSYKKIVKN